MVRAAAGCMSGAMPRGALRLCAHTRHRNTTRRAARHRIRQGVEIQLDGNAANVVDLSVIGAQVVSATILRPNQRVRISVPTDEFMMRFRGAVAWAKFELPQPTEPPRYRAGIEFLDADLAAMEDYCNRHKR